MTLNKTLFVVQESNPKLRLPLPKLLEHHDELRDAIAASAHSLPSDLPGQIAIHSFVYAFNTYKAIGMLLRDSYHECGAALLRQLWEVSVNLHWIGQDPAARADDFCNFTIMEHRKLMQKTGDSGAIPAFDDATRRFQERFKFRDRKGRDQTHSHFAKKSICERASDLGHPWKREYETLYHLTSMHSHGAPGAILDAMFQEMSSMPEVREEKAVGFVAVMSIHIIMRDFMALVQQHVHSESQAVANAFTAFEATMGEVASSWKAQ